MRILGIALLLVLTACSTGDTEVTIAPEPPEQIVEEWLTGLEAVDVDVLADITAAHNVALVAGAENGFTAEQMVAVADQGLPAATARSYWTSFRDGFTDFLVVPMSQVEVGGVGRFSVDDEQFAAVGIALGESTAEVLLHAEPDGWRVDLVATVGPALAVQIRRLVATLVDEADDDIARRYAQTALASLGAALARDPANRALELEIEAIEDLPIDLSR